MELTLKIKDNLYNEILIPPKKEGAEPTVKRKLIKRNVITHITIDSNDILTTSDLLSSKGTILKNYCKIHIKEVGPIIVNHTREQINKLKKHNARTIGFRQKASKS